MILFISDLHLSIDKPEITRRFLSFLENRAAGAEALYILGDLFDAWIGDDDPTPPNGKIKHQLKKLTAAGTPVYLQLGNRDFLLGERFCDQTGVTLLGDYEVIDLYGTPTLLTHGDLLCTDDLPYQAFRVRSRTPEWIRSVLSKPLLLRLVAARWYRWRSYWHKRKKSLEIMDVNQETVSQIMKKYGCLQLIHGHTHRPNVHDFQIDGNAARRFVLAAWNKEAGQTLCWTSQGYRIETV
ncbi:MAG: UDP-2,3-diacylglucosamine diphosphatase [Methylomicrobium sp.]